MIKSLLFDMERFLNRYPELRTNATIHQFEGDSFVVHVNDGVNNGINKSPQFSVQYAEKYDGLSVCQDGWTLLEWRHDGDGKINIKKQVDISDITNFTNLINDMFKASDAGIKPFDFFKQ